MADCLHRIYLNHHLTKLNQELYMKARFYLKKSGIFAALSCRADGTITANRTQESRPIKIFSAKDLENLLEQEKC